MPILDLKKAIEKDFESAGTVLINVEPQIRVGKKNPYMIGEFLTKDGKAEFKIWEERTYAVVSEVGVGLYDVEVTGSEFNGAYLTVRRIAPYQGESLGLHDFLPAIAPERLSAYWNTVVQELSAKGVSFKAWQLAELLIKAPELGGRFWLEGAAVRHHDNKIGGLVNHVSKMLSILAALLANHKELAASADLLALGIILHDVGKVFEYDNLSMGEYWYSNHRVRGIEFIAAYKDSIIASYDEAFYRQLQSIISGHHGEYGDRPTTVAAAVVHYIDTLESQVTGLIEAELEQPGERVRQPEWGWLKPLELSLD